MTVGIIILVLCVGFLGRLARGLHENYNPHPLRTGAVLAAIFALLAAMLDVVTGSWYEIGLSSNVDIVAGFAVYLLTAMYLLLAVYCRRIVPFTFGSREKVRRPP